MFCSSHRNQVVSRIQLHSYSGHLCLMQWEVWLVPTICMLQTMHLCCLAVSAHNSDNILACAIVMWAYAYLCVKQISGCSEPWGTLESWLHCNIAQPWESYLHVCTCVWTCWRRLSRYCNMTALLSYLHVCVYVQTNSVGSLHDNITQPWQHYWHSFIYACALTNSVMLLHCNITH